jgi:hypothetical protein
VINNLPQARCSSDLQITIPSLFQRLPQPAAQPGENLTDFEQLRDSIMKRSSRNRVLSGYGPLI